jgi:hypothetical protein
VTAVVLSEVERFDGTSKASGKPFTKFTLKDGNGEVLGNTFNKALGDAAMSLKGQRVDVDTKPAQGDFPPEVTAIRPAVEEPATSGDERMSKEEWRAKDRRADKRACIAIAASSMQHTLKSEPTPADLKLFVERVLVMARLFNTEVQAEFIHALEDAGIDGANPDGEEVPI